MSESTNFKHPMSGMDRYGKERLELAMFVRDKILDHLSIPWTIENGTLLGAWRNGKYILHDDDFDIALFFDYDPIPVMPDLTNRIKQLLPANYEARMVTSYTQKIEIFDPSYGEYTLLSPEYQQAPYHHVTVDLQFYQRHNDVYKIMQEPRTRLVTIAHADVFPIGSIELEGETFQAPGNTVSFLKSIYGSLSPNAKFNLKTGLYEDCEH